MHTRSAHSSFSTVQVAYNLLTCSSTALSESQALCLSAVSLFPLESFRDPCWTCYIWISRHVIPAWPGGGHTTSIEVCYQQARYQTLMSLLVNLLQSFLPASRKAGRMRMVSSKLLEEQPRLHLFTGFLLYLPFLGICVQIVIMHHQLLFQVGRNGEFVSSQNEGQTETAPSERGQYFLTLRNGYPVSWRE